MQCKFQVGQKVVCVVNTLFSDLLEEGTVYTIEGVTPEKMVLSFDGIRPHFGLVLREVQNPGPEDGSFNAARFRPVVERGTRKGMSILRNILNKTHKPVEVENA